MAAERVLPDIGRQFPRMLAPAALPDKRFTVMLRVLTAGESSAMADNVKRKWKKSAKKRALS